MKWIQWMVWVGAISVGWTQERPDPDAMFQWMDHDGDGRIALDEIPERFREVLRRMDRNGDGYVSREEHSARFAQRGAPSSPPGSRRPETPPLPDSIRLEADIPYAGTDHPRQRLDVLLPRHPNSSNLPVVVFIHGGGWIRGDKSAGRRHLVELVASGDFVGVSIGYRFISEAVFPAQIHDCKAAIRWVRANASRYGCNPDKIAVWGLSAGGHLALLLGTSGAVPELEGSLGPWTNQSSRVACVVNFFGPSQLDSMGRMSGPDSAIAHDAADSPESRLIGGPLQEHLDKARAASPITYVSSDDPPFLHVHGTGDRLVPFGQAKAIHEALRAAGVPSVLITVEGGGHGQGFPPEVRALVREFLYHHLWGRPAQLQDRTVPAVSSSPASSTRRWQRSDRSDGFDLSGR